MRFLTVSFQRHQTIKKPLGMPFLRPWLQNSGINGVAGQLGYTSAASRRYRLRFWCKVSYSRGLQSKKFPR